MGCDSVMFFLTKYVSISFQYLEHGDYNRTQQIFEQECSDKNRHISQSSGKVQSNQKLLAVQVSWSKPLGNCLLFTIFTLAEPWFWQKLRPYSLQDPQQNSFG